MIYGYFSVRTGLTKNELRNNFANSKLYKEYLEMVDSLKGLFFYIPDDEISSPSNIIDESMVFSPQKTLQVDIMTSKRNGMHFKLDSIIRYAEEHPLEPISIVICSINVFGNSESIKNYYHKFRKHKIGILLPDYTRECGLSEYSTYNFGFEFRPQNELNRAYDLIERLTDDDIPDNRGREAGEYTKTFRVAFWLYELFRIPEKTAVSMSGLSKNGFHMKADKYEQTINYKRELSIMEEKFQISKYIKRNRPVPENFEKLMHWEEKMEKKKKKKEEWKLRQEEKQKKKWGKKLKERKETEQEEASSMTSLELACIHCKVPMIFPEDYKRLKLKMVNGKKELARCIKMYDEDLLARFDEWIKAGKTPTEFYTTCNMEQYLQ